MDEWIKLYEKTKNLHAGELVPYDQVEKIIRAGRTSGTFNREIHRWKEEMSRARKLEPQVKANLGYKLIKISKGESNG